MMASCESAPSAFIHRVGGALVFVARGVPVVAAVHRSRHGLMQARGDCGLEREAAVDVLRGRLHRAEQALIGLAAAIGLAAREQVLAEEAAHGLGDLALMLGAIALASGLQARAPR